MRHCPLFSVVLNCWRLNRLSANRQCRWWQHAVLTLSLAYFLYDTACCTLINRDVFNMIHHLLTILGLAVGFRGRSGTELTLCLLLMEVLRVSSTSYLLLFSLSCEYLLHCLRNTGLKPLPAYTLTAPGALFDMGGWTFLSSAREVLRCNSVQLDSTPAGWLKHCVPAQELGKQNTKAALANDLLFAGTFFVCRLLFGPVVVYHTLTSQKTHEVVKLGGAGIQCVSVFWFLKVLQVCPRGCCPLASLWPL